MNRATRDKFVSGTQTDLTTGNACWQTAPEVFKKLDADFGPFDLDLTADANNHLCEFWFGPGSPLMQDALAAPWAEYGGSGYSNPPYGAFVPKILKHAWHMTGSGFSTTLLLPMRVTKAFQHFIIPHASALYFCDKRLVFYENGAPRLNPKTGKPDVALFDSIVVRFTPHKIGPLYVDLWQVPKHT